MKNLKKPAIALAVASTVAIGLLPLAPSLSLVVLVPVVIYLIGSVTTGILAGRRD